LQASLAVVFGSSCADPDHAAGDCARPFIGDNFDAVAAAERKTCPQSETVQLNIEDYAGGQFKAKAEVDDDGGSPLCDDALRAANLGNRDGAHQFLLEAFSNAELCPK